ncbi:hypothetical protein GCM10010399_22760 [Dactylosporangium fulvum]|uniref:Substrate-binding domain-containing protein n=1 Tax=Dactylosporangium fulvum TaxID=53359 RepID=A0ABY5W9A5_9ACTN|nr:substrate-binding domain-containing protein [Dactylosporangium fulvum]UWP85666.1 substrate-binding domain-containing protein [Dactylosporangium fulvum]
MPIGNPGAQALHAAVQPALRKPRLKRSSVWLGACLAVIALATAACGTSPDAGGSSGSTAGTTKVDVGDGQTVNAKPVRNVAFLMGGSVATNEYAAALAKGAKEAAEKYGVDLSIFEANFDINTQYNQLQNTLTSGKYQAMIVQPTTPQVCKQVQQGVKRYQVLITVLGSTLCGQDDSSGDELASPGTVSFVGGMYNTPGQEAFLKDCIAHSPGKHQALALLGPEYFGTTKAWKAAGKLVLPDNPDFRITREVNTNWSTPDAFKRVQDALQGAPDIDVIISAQSDLTKGAVRAIKSLGREGKIRVYEMGGGKDSVALVQSGEVYSTFPTYPKSSAYAALEALVKASKGETVPRFIDRDGNPNGVLEGIPADKLSSYTPEW